METGNYQGPVQHDPKPNFQCNTPSGMIRIIDKNLKIFSILNMTQVRHVTMVTARTVLSEGFRADSYLQNCRKIARDIYRM